MLTEIKNNLKKNIFIDIEGAHIPVNETSSALNEVVTETKVVRSFRTVADMESGKFRRLFNRHKVAYKLI